MTLSVVNDSGVIASPHWELEMPFEAWAVEGNARGGGVTALDVAHEHCLYRSTHAFRMLPGETLPDRHTPYLQLSCMTVTRALCNPHLTPAALLLMNPEELI